MSRTIRFKLSEEEFRIVLNASRGLGVSVDQLARQSLVYTLNKARELRDAGIDKSHAQSASGPSSAGVHSEQSGDTPSDPLAD